MILPGLPDLSGVLRERELAVFRPYARAGAYTVLPDSLAVIRREGGALDFHLERVRGQHPAQPPAPYGVLEMGVGPQYRWDDALQLARRECPEATIAPPQFNAGFLRLAPAGDLPDADPALLAPVPLVWNGLGAARFVLRLPLSAAVLLQGALEGRLLLLTALAELEFPGVAATLPLRVRFDPAKVLAALRAHADAEGRLAWERCVRLLAEDPAALGITCSGPLDDSLPSRFAESMADRLRHRFGTFVPAPVLDGQTYFALPAPGPVPGGDYQWDLAQPLAVHRAGLWSFNPLSEAQRVMAEPGTAPVIQQVIVPAFPPGAVSIGVGANLPSPRLGVLALGVTLRLPPRPPHRPQAVVRALELEPPRDRATTWLPQSPAESLEYFARTFAFVDVASGVEKMEGAETVHTTPQLLLALADFPLACFPLEASAALLELGEVSGVCRGLLDGAPIQQAFTLKTGQSTVLLALPQGVTETTLECELRSRDTGKCLRLGPVPAGPMRWELASFREYGPQRIVIECRFPNGAQVAAFDFLPEGQPETAPSLTVLHFTPAQPRREWTWFAASPFQSGYRFRPHPRPDQTAAPWSEPRSAFEPLDLEAQDHPGGSS